MACNLTKGRGLDCKNVMGGVKRIYIQTLADTSFTKDAPAAGQINAVDIAEGGVASANNLYQYDLPRGTASLTETITGSSENGTVFYEPSVNIKLHALKVADRNELKLLTQNRTIIFCELQQQYDNGHNVIVVVGCENGMDLLTGTEASGTAAGDMNGYDYTFTGSEPQPMYFLEDYTSAPFDNSGFDVSLVNS